MGVPWVAVLDAGVGTVCAASLVVDTGACGPPGARGAEFEREGGPIAC